MMLENVLVSESKDGFALLYGRKKHNIVKQLNKLIEN